MAPSSRACSIVALFFASANYLSARAQSNASSNLSACVGTRARALVPSNVVPRTSPAVWLEARSGGAVTLVDVLAVKERRASALRCALGSGAPACDVRLVLALETVAEDGALALDIGLDADTNVPDVASAEGLSSFLVVSSDSFSCPVFLLGGSWLSPSSLRVRVSRPNCSNSDKAAVRPDGRAADGSALVAALVMVARPRDPEDRDHPLVSREVSRGLVGAFLLVDDNEQSDALFLSGLDLAETGNFSLRLCAEEDGSRGDNCTERLADQPPSLSGCVCRVLAARSLLVKSCAAEEFVALGASHASQTLHASRQNSTHRVAASEVAERPNPAWSLRGVASVGEMGLVVPFGNLPEGARTQGSWSLSFWAVSTTDPPARPPTRPPTSNP